MGLRPENLWVGGYVDYQWRHLRHIVEALPVALPGLRVLEFGCNVGASAIVLSSLGADVCGIDVDPRMVALSGLNARRHGFDELDFRHVPDTRRMPFDAAEFDLVVCDSVLEYVAFEKLRAVQREIDRVVRPGGLILVTGSSSRAWPFEVHSRRWLSNYLPRPVDRLLKRPPVRGIWPWHARYGFGPRYVNLDSSRADAYFNRSRLLMGAPRRRLQLLRGVASLLRIGPGLLARNVSCLLQKPR